MYNQKEMESYVRRMKLLVDKYESGKLSDPSIYYELVSKGWTNPFYQKVAWGYVIQRLSSSKLAKILEVSDWTIRSALEELGIPRRDESQSKRPIPLESHEKNPVINLILGTMLGDGSIKKSYPNSIASKYRHTNIQKEYHIFIKEKLEENNIKCGSFSKQYKKESNYSDWFTVETFTYEWFYDLRQEWYPEGIKIVPKSLELNPEILLYWYLDDGNYTRDQIILSTEGFDTKSQKYLRLQLLNKFSIKSKIAKNKSAGLSRIRLNKKDAIKFKKLTYQEYKKTGLSCFNYKFPV